MNAGELLGFPAAAAADFADPALGHEYASFVERLLVVANGRVVLADPYQLSVQTTGLSESASAWYADLTDQDRCKLLLLSVIAKPFDRSCLWPDGQDRITDDEIVALMFANPNPQSLAEHQTAVPFGLDTVAGRRQSSAEPTLKSLVDMLPRQASIETISSEFIGGQPGNYGYQMWQVCRWTDQWGVVFGVTDAGRDEGYPFPWTLGFCRLDRLERNFVELLREGSRRYDIGFYYTYGKVLTRWRLAKLALVSDDESEGPDWETVNWLLGLDDDSLQKMLRDTDQDTDTLGFVRRVRGIRDSAAIDDVGLAELLRKSGSDASIEWLEARIRDLEQAQEEHDRQESEERNRRIALFEDAITVILAQLPDQPSAAWHNNARRQIVRRYVEDHIAKHSAMPTGQHDFGVVNLRTGLRSSPIQIGVVDFGGNS